MDESQAISPPATRSKRFLSDDLGNPSSMRLMSLLALVVAAYLARISHKFSTALRNIGTGADFAGFATLQGVDPASSAPLPEAHTSTRPPFAPDEFCEKCRLATVQIFEWGSDGDKTELVLYFLVAAFAPKAVQKFAEK